MKTSAKVDPSSDSSDSGRAADPHRKRSSRTKKTQGQKKSGKRNSGIREVEEVRALLEAQLGSLYWWVFNACKMKGFIRAKELHKAAKRQVNSTEISSKVKG